MYEVNFSNNQPLSSIYIWSSKNNKKCLNLVSQSVETNVRSDYIIICINIEEYIFRNLTFCSQKYIYINLKHGRASI
jgi:hypothetical protein